MIRIAEEQVCLIFISDVRRIRRGGMDGSSNRKIGRTRHSCGGRGRSVLENVAARGVQGVSKVGQSAGLWLVIFFMRVYYTK